MSKLRLSRCASPSTSIHALCVKRRDNRFLSFFILPPSMQAAWAAWLAEKQSEPLIGTRLFHRRMQVRVGRHTDRPRRHSTRRRRDRHRHLRRRHGVVHRARRHAHDARVRKPERSAAVFLCVPDIFFGEAPPFYFCMQAKGDTERKEQAHS